jgi:hypothetical protein
VFYWILSFLHDPTKGVVMPPSLHGGARDVRRNPTLRLQLGCCREEKQHRVTPSSPDSRSLPAGPLITVTGLTAVIFVPHTRTEGRGDTLTYMHRVSLPPNLPEQASQSHSPAVAAFSRVSHRTESGRGWRVLRQRTHKPKVARLIAAAAAVGLLAASSVWRRPNQRRTSTRGAVGTEARAACKSLRLRAATRAAVVGNRSAS